MSGKKITEKIRTCEEEGRRAYVKKDGRCTGTREETQRETENQEGKRLRGRQKTRRERDSEIWKVWGLKVKAIILGYNGQDKVDDRNPYSGDPRSWGKPVKKTEE